MKYTLEGNSSNRPNAWSGDELALLRRHWSGALPVRMWRHELPARTETAILSMANFLDLPRRTVRPNVMGSMTWNVIRRILCRSSPLSCRELAELTGLSRNYIGVELRARCPADVHIAGYTTGRHKEALWKLGRGRDAEKPAALSKAEVARRHRARRRSIRRDISASWIPSQ